MQPGRKTRASVKNKKGNGKMAADAEDEGSELEQGGRKAAALPPMPDKFAVAKRSPADFIACPDGAMMRVGTNKKSRDVFWDHFGHLRNGSVWHASDYKKAGKCPGNAKKFLGYSDWLVAEDPIPVARAKRSRARSTDSAESYHDEEETPPARKKSKTAGKKTPSRKPVGRSSPVKRRTPAADPEAETFSIEVVSSASPSVKSATFHASAEQQPATRARTAEAPASPGSSREVAEPPTGNANPIAEEGADGLLRRLGLQDTNALWNWAVGTPIDIKRGGRG
ncbi:hypothetical protein B0A53_05571 [Rhodotorula sp. CCFEE 5036]|nr:hypothetical protein B0A53_05571 [Rhodotorula sp. CCFEE 5036]